MVWIVTVSIAGITVSYEPSRILRKDGGEEWYSNGKRHRLDGPAITYGDGSEYWFCNGQLHRRDGPAMITPLGEEWYCHGIRHRDCGPATVYRNGYREWLIDGELIPNVLTTVNGRRMLFTNCEDGELNFDRFPSYHYDESIGGFTLDDVDLTLFRIEHEVVEMLYE